MSIFTNQVGINLTQDKIQLIEIVERDANLYLENADEEYFDEPISDSTKESKFIHILQNSFNEIILRKPVSSQNISISLTPSYFKVFEIPADKNLTKNDLNDYIAWEITKLFPSEKKKYFSYQMTVLNSLDFHPYKRILVFAIPIALLSRLHKFCSRNSLKLHLVDNAHTAFSSFMQNDENKNLTLSLFIENNFCSVLLFTNDGLVFGSNSKYNSVSELPNMINDVIEVNRTRELVSDKISRLYLNGNYISPELSNSISEATSLEISNFDPLKNLTINPLLDESKFNSETLPKFTSAIAMALRLKL